MENINPNSGLENYKNAAIIINEANKKEKYDLDDWLYNYRRHILGIVVACFL